MSFYYAPELSHLETVGEIEWRDEPYEFDLTAVWVDPATKALYFADDSGCSCPMPFEDLRKVDDLTKVGRMQDLMDHCAERRAGQVGGYGRNDQSLTELDREIASLIHAAIKATA